MGRSLQLVLLDNQDLQARNVPLTAIVSLRKTLSESLAAHWSTVRDAYIAHGDATKLLGRGSRRLYTFVRKRLGIPLLCTRRLETPKLQKQGGTIEEAPTVGSYNSMLYVAIKDGTILETLLSILQDSDVAVQFF
ncbi:hypothetical protein CC80DRAFT_548355 [Byssothecium circinans]|uniref:Uncharacterized protein n=1 Tax=Byssothecium circinans TaxID=147558 RepID=A0A6A5TW43_9PLEO|nr:hypothetical protein CC80DRAFT_548355 [Byssothecium circinans]